MAESLSSNRICVTGGAGFLGRVVCQVLRDRGAPSIIVPRSSEYDLTRADAARRLFDDHKPDVVIHLAAEVGGIGANQANPGRFFFANMAMGLNLIEEARVRGVEKFVQVGTVCSYPKNCPAPFREESLWDGFPEETNAPYGVAKRTLGVMLDAYRRQYGFNGIYLIPVNLYGPGDNFDLESSHVIPALMRKAHEAKLSGAADFSVWGSGKPLREFLYVDDLADALVFLLERYSWPVQINLGTGEELSIRELAETVGQIVGFKGTLRFDTSKPDGAPRKLLDNTRVTEMGWSPKTPLAEGLAKTYSGFLENFTDE